MKIQHFYQAFNFFYKVSQFDYSSQQQGIWTGSFFSFLLSLLFVSGNPFFVLASSFLTCFSLFPFPLKGHMAG